VRGKVDRRWTVVVLTLAVAGILLAVSGVFVPVRPGPSLPTGPSNAIAPGIPRTAALPPVAPRVAVPSPDVAVPSWINVSRTGPNASPPGEWLGSLAYDPVDKEVVAFGGCSFSVCPENYTWVFSDGVWTNITNPQDAPSARWAATMDFDPNMGGVLLFGGVNTVYLNDTWLFRGGA